VWAAFAGVKNRVIVQAVLAGLSQSEAARRYGVSQPRVSQLMARYRAAGLEAADAQSRRPRSSPAAIAPHIALAVVAMRAHLHGQGLDAGADTIAVMLRLYMSPAAASAPNRSYTAK
jgi:hypothetical protein